MTQFAPLPDRAVLEITGPDRVDFLQGLVSNDVALAAPGHAVWAALLTPQGKWLADFFIFADGERLLLDCEAGQAAMLVQRLTRHRLRARVVVAETSLHVYASWNGPSRQDDADRNEPLATKGIAAPDPRLPASGWRLLAPIDIVGNADADDYDRHRIALGLPDGSRDLESEKTVLLEAGFDELNGISWTKGCYMGQELTARTRYRGLIKRRLVPVQISGTAREHADILQDGKLVGSLRSVRDDLALASLRISALNTLSPLSAHGVELCVLQPGWLRLQAEAV